ncbi:MAG: MFS transporter [Oscillospiraceae bacterium]|nr:MFS transporter [Oscillospiraceae bacterium]
MAKKERKKGGLTKKHWFGYMFGDWGGCMTFALMASTFTMYCTNALGMYMYSAVYHDLTYQSISSALSSPFMIGSMILVPFLCKKVGLEKLIRYSLLIGGVICGGLFVMHMVMDVHPLVHGVILGIGSGMAMVSIQMQWGLVGEAIDYNEFVTGKRTEGSIYGTFNLSRRIGQTIGQGCALYGLGWIGYEGTAAVQSTGTIFGLKVLVVLIPAVFILGSWAAFKFVWNITPEIRAAMAEKKAAAAAAKAAASAK